MLCHACVLALDTVFTRALETFGSSGPDTCHPFAHRYDVVDAVFIEEVPHPQADPSLGLKISKFTITDPNNPDVHTGATVDNSSILPSNLQQGDVLRLEVVSSFPTKATLTTPFAIGFMKPLDRKRSVVIIDMRVLGFVESRTDKFRARPHAVEFVLQLSRHHHLATVSPVRGVTMKSRMFGIHSVLFVAEEGDLQHWLTTYHLDSTNTFIIGAKESHINVPLECIRVCEYHKKNTHDIDISLSSDICIFLASIVDKSNVGIHINEFVHS